jgi:hypothetical protein
MERGQRRRFSDSVESTRDRGSRAGRRAAEPTRQSCSSPLGPRRESLPKTCHHECPCDYPRKPHIRPDEPLNCNRNVAARANVDRCAFLRPSNGCVHRAAVGPWLSRKPRIGGSGATVVGRGLNQAHLLWNSLSSTSANVLSQSIHNQRRQRRGYLADFFEANRS